jgi:16S rRNA (uracil1498-N3)-methyltransferase
MRLTRVHVDTPLASGALVTLSGSAASHVTRVLRLRSGEALTLFDGRGGEYSARIEQGGAAVTVAVGEHHPTERESPLAVTLAQGISRGERMDLVVQKATELGVARLQPLLTERSVVRLDAQQAERKRRHWRAIAIGACEQCGRNRLPEIRAPCALRELLGGPAAAPAPAPARQLRLLLSPAAERRVGDLEGPVNALTVLIGPEGGLSAEEQAAAAAAGFLAVRLGPRVLRTETAAIAALTLLQREFGDI